MADRSDNSQYPVDDTNDNDGTYAGDSTMDNDVIQEHAESDYATADEMVHYIPPEMVNDYLRVHGERFRVKTTRTENRLYSRQIIMSTMVDSGPGIIGGFSFMELTGTAPALVSFHDGIDANAAVILEVPLLAGRGERFLFGPESGIHYRYGLYVSIDSGAVRGNFFHVVPTAV